MPFARFLEKERSGSPMEFWQSIQLWWQGLCDQFTQCFIEDDRWEYITDGLLVTL